MARQCVIGVFELATLHPRHPETPKGSRTWEWLVPDGKRQITVYKRLDGEIAGEHFHKGEDPSKNPEYFLLVSGKIRFEFINESGTLHQVELSAENGPVELIIYPFALHRATPLTDCCFIEYRKTIFDPEKSDTFGPEHFTIKTDWQENEPSLKKGAR